MPTITISGLSLLLFSALSVSLLQIALRLSQKRGRNVMTCIAVSYLVATAICYVGALAFETLALSSFTLCFGILMGIAFLVGMITIVVSFPQRGVALTSAIVQLAVLVPIVMSILIWNERATTVQTIGILLAIVALPLLNIKGEDTGTLGRWLVLTTVALFFVNGFCLSAGKILLETGHLKEQLPFYVILYGTAFAASIPFALKGRKKSSTLDFGYGSAIGIFNATSNLSLIAALTMIPGPIAFPLYSTAGSLLTIALSVSALHERISKINAMGVASSIAAVVLITT